LTNLLKSQKTLFKRELDAEKCHTAAQVQLKKDAVKAATSSKQALKRDFDKQKKSYDSLLRTSNTNKVKISSLSCSQFSLLQTRTGLQNEVKNLTKEVKVLTKKIDNQLDKKLNHELCMQKMRNEYKQQLDLDQALSKHLASLFALRR
jgi:chromosome segregation ATPase